MSKPVDRLSKPSSDLVCFLRAADGRMVCGRQASGTYVLARDSGSYFELTETEDHKLFLRSGHGTYLSAGQDGVIRSALSPSGWESFAVENDAHGRSWLRSFHGTYLLANLERGTLELGTCPAPNQYLTLAPAYDRDRYHDILCRTLASGRTEKTVWTFWDRGAERMSPFYRLNVDGWRSLLGPSWRVEVLNVVEGHGCNVRNFVDAEDLPASFDRLSPVTQSEAVRLALLKRNGGVWMDASIVLVKTLDEICWRGLADVDQDLILAGFCDTGWGSDHLDRRDYFESWFIATRRDNELVDLWHQVFVDYWSDRTVSSASWAHPLFASVDLSNFKRYGKDFRNYLLAHIAFRRVIEHDPVMKAIWRHNTLLREAGDEGFYLTRVTGWDPDRIYAKLIEEKDAALAERLLRTCLMKFTSSMVGRLAGLSRAELLDERHTLGTIYARLFAGNPGGVIEPA
jgi:Capsular polysaccharide synthesis protein